ncbi:MAG TPA: 5-formyltetrahydrofolate cyclo-ligase [Verrucomicrobiales bacterium]|nr:5-formyltetrahydrofolate cyclo-ligase [Verrucomicrobiales bacterium]
MENEKTKSNLSLVKCLARRESRKVRDTVTKEVLREGSRAVCRLILESSHWMQAEQIMLYMPLPDELDIKPLLLNGLKNKKRVALPRFSTRNNVYEISEISSLNNLVAGKFGISEPSKTSKNMDMMQLDLVIICGLAFDRLGGRLGRGGGFFDRLLSETNAKKCGVCFDQQVHAAVPMEKHDIKMDMIATPSGWLVPPPT